MFPAARARALLLAFAWLISLASVARAGASEAPGPQVLELKGDTLGVHDPVIIRQNDTYYVFSTNGAPGKLIPIRCSKDLRNWTLCGHVFEQLPAWARQEIPGARMPWAPDISWFQGKYHLYYSVSTFGKNESAIGLATNRTLDPSSPEYKWVDEGMVVRSRKDDDWNAIDPNIVIQNERAIWLSWGSFWGGIKMRRIDPATGKTSQDDTRLYALASRPRKGPQQTPPVVGAIEAPFIVKHGRYWYLFVSFDFCCRGVRSDYHVVVGRARKVTGPYVDRSGQPMSEGGGTAVTQAKSPNWRGPGHEAVLRDGRTDYLVFHAYHGQTGRPHLQISTMVWDHGWPRVGDLP